MSPQEQTRATRRPPPAAQGVTGSDRLALGAWIALALALHVRALGTGFVETDLSALDTVLRTHLDALLRGGALPGGFAPLSRELYWWLWGGVVQLDALAFHVLNAAIVVAGAWFLYRAVERWAGPRAAMIAGLALTTFPPLGALLHGVSGARELSAVMWCAAALLTFARGHWILSGAACGLAALSGGETVMLPLVLLVVDASQRPVDDLRPRLRRLLPAFLLCWAAAAWVARVGPGVAKPAPAGASVLGWFARAFVPAGALSGLTTTVREAPLLVLAVVVLAVLAVPRGRSTAGERPIKSMLAIGGAAALLPLLPLAFAAEPPRAERFAVAAVGVALAASALALANPWLARGVVALAALASLGANASPSASRLSGPRFTSAAAIRAEAATIGPLLAALRPRCRELATVPRTFAVGVPPDSTFRLVLDPGARVVCRDARVAVRFVAELTSEDAARPFGVLRFDPSAPSFRFEAADAQVRARVGEGLLVFARHAPAAACFEAAIAERPDDRELVYPTVVALAAAQRLAEARARWEAATRAGLAPRPDTLATRLLAGYSGDDAEAVRREVTRRAVAVVSDPTSAAAHLDLGRYLLQIGRARSGTLEISVACGIGRRSQDIFWLARGYDAMGAQAEALEAYRATLSGGLDSTNYSVARERLYQLLRSFGPGAFGPSSRP